MPSSEMRAGLPILAFADAGTFEDWFKRAPADSPGLWLRLAKDGSGHASLSKAEAIDAALCHGWIDGQLNPYDEDWWLIIAVMVMVLIIGFLPHAPDLQYRAK